MYDIDELVEMLKYCRPHGSVTEEVFIEKYITPLDVHRDEYGNLIKMVGDDTNILWSCHTDTVHNKQGLQDIVIRNRVAYAVENNCLGADCTTGVWLMVNMIRAQIPGVYIFHREEEIGMRGAKFIAQTYGEDVSKLKAAIAFDRYGYNSIITHQMGQRGCSEIFSKSLAAQLDLNMKSDDGGVYTDTYQYMDIISECTNVSVGYHNQHSSKESQDLDFAEELMKKLLTFDESKLEFVRDPNVKEYGYGMFGEYYGRGRAGAYSPYGTWEEEEPDEKDWIEEYYSGRKGHPEEKLYSMAEIVRLYPEEAAKLLLDSNYSEDDVIGTVVFTS